MSFDETDIQNKMIQTPPAQKGWHFPSDGAHFAEFIEAETIQEATAIYHTVKRLLPTSSKPQVPTGAPAQSTALAEPEEVDNR